MGLGNCRLECSRLTEIAPISRQSYAISMTACCLMAIGVGMAAASAAGAEGETLVAILVALLACASLTIIPLIGPPLVTSDRWGLAVMATSAGRTMVALMGMLILLEVQNHPRKPVVYALLVATLVMMIAEAAIAVRLLAKRDRDRKLLSTPAGVSPSQASPGSGSNV